MTLEKQIAEDYGMVLKEAQSMGCNKINALYNIPLDNMKAIVNALEEIEQYRENGTVEKVREYKEIADNMDAVSLAALCISLNKLKEYQKIGTPEECRAAVEKQKVDKELESHDEKHILKSCLGLMQEMVNDFAEWYRWQHGEDSIEGLDEEEIFCIRKTYFQIVQELFLLHTNHSGGTSTRAKCEQLGVDWGEEISFDWSEEE